MKNCTRKRRSVLKRTDLLFQSMEKQNMTRYNRYILMTLLLAVCVVLPVFAGAVPEDQTWYLPNTDTSNPYFYFDLATDTYQAEIVQIGSSLKGRALTTTITSSDNFLFINDENPTATHPYSLSKYNDNYERDRFLGIITSDWYIRSKDSPTVYQSGSPVSFTLPAGTYTQSLVSGNLRLFKLAHVSITIPAAPSTLSAGTYSTRLKFTLTAPYYSNDYPAVELSYDIVLKAKYKTNIEGGESGFTDFYFSITPTSSTYNFDIEGNIGYVDVADIHFTFSERTTSKKTYGNDPFVVGVSASGDGWTMVNDPYTFRRIGSEYQEESDANTIAYQTRLVNENYGTGYGSSLGDGRYQYVAPHTIVNQLAASSYYNVFEYKGKAQIQITGDNVDALAPGRYSTNLYFYIIKN